MTRLIVHVEGQTEELFVNETLAPHLYKKGFTLISARLIGNARLRANRGGIKGWDSVKRDIQRHLEQDRGCYVTTMVDYYALPQSGQKAWPGRHEATDLPHDFKAQHIENLLQQEVIAFCNSHTAINRFIPYIALHEFEALLFSDCHAFASSLNCFEVESQLYTIRNSFQTPEHINDSRLIKNWNGELGSGELGQIPIKNPHGAHPMTHDDAVARDQSRHRPARAGMGVWQT